MIPGREELEKTMRAGAYDLHTDVVTKTDAKPSDSDSAAQTDPTDVGPPADEAIQSWEPGLRRAYQLLEDEMRAQPSPQEYGLIDRLQTRINALLGHTVE